jgi:DNA-binding transcriptional ArsR family regulator
MQRAHSLALSDEALELVATWFRTLGDPLRIALLRALRRGEQNVGTLVDAVGSTQPNVSKHLKLLQETGLVRRRQDGTAVYYAITDPTVFDLCDSVCRSIRDQLAHAASLAREFGPTRERRGSQRRR